MWNWSRPWSPMRVENTLVPIQLLMHFKLVEPWMFSGTFFSEGTWVPITMGAKSKMSENQGTSGSWQWHWQHSVINPNRFASPDRVCSAVRMKTSNPISLLKTYSHSFFGHGDGSKPWYLVNPKIAGKWMFIPLKMVSIGIDPYPHAMILIVNHASFWNNVGACSQSWEEIWRHFTCPKSLQTCREPSQPCFETQLVKHFAVQNLHFTCESCKKCFRKSL